MTDTLASAVAGTFWHIIGTKRLVEANKIRYNGGQPIVLTCLTSLCSDIPRTGISFTRVICDLLVRHRLGQQF